ncbi:MAG: hypothetical protein KC619_09580 [Myxococcales bacterium]|nr:hypothetical protein [Myxococcales bacterium]
MPSKTATTDRGRGRYGLAVGAVGLTLGTAIQKLAVLATKARAGQLGGTETLGDLTSVLGLAGIVGAVLHFGLPDRAMYAAAAGLAGDDARPGARHGLFLLSAAIASAGSLAGAAWMATDPAFGAAIAVGAGAQHAGTLALVSLRGAGRPRLEAATLSLTGIALLAGAWLAPSPRILGAIFAVQGLLFVAATAVVVRIEPALRPRLRGARAAIEELQGSLPYFVVGSGGLALGMSDVLVARSFLGSGATGELECATVALKAGVQVPWLLSTVWLRRLHERWRSGEPTPRLGLVATGGGLGVAAGVAAVLTGPLVAWVFEVPASVFEDALFRAALLAPPVYGAVLLLPIATARAIRATVRVTLAAVGVGVAGAMLGARFGLAGVQVGQTTGYVVLLVGGALALREPETPS